MATSLQRKTTGAATEIAKVSESGSDSAVELAEKFPGWRDFDRDTFDRFFTASEAEIFRAFGELRGRAVFGPDFLYLPGTDAPERRALMVAHVDTVAKKLPTVADLDYDGGILTRWNGVLGADDRAGILALWAIANGPNGSGPSILLTDGEERGGIGAHSVTKHMERDEIAAHAYAVEPDRYGDGQAVFYSGTDGAAFRAWLDATISPRFGWGSYTDIATVCPWAGLCGVNISIGYLHQHTSREILSLDAWQRGVDALRALVSSTDVPPNMTPDPYKPVAYNSWHWWRNEDESDGGAGLGLQRSEVAVLNAAGDVLCWVDPDEIPESLITNDGSVYLDDLEDSADFLEPDPFDWTTFKESCAACGGEDVQGYVNGARWCMDCLTETEGD